MCRTQLKSPCPMMPPLAESYAKNPEAAPGTRWPNTARRCTASSRRTKCGHCHVPGTVEADEIVAATMIYRGPGSADEPQAPLEHGRLLDRNRSATQQLDDIRGAAGTAEQVALILVAF